MSEHHGIMPQAMGDGIRKAYESICTLEGTENPVVKKLVHVSGDAAQVYMEDAKPITQEAGEPAGPEQQGAAAVVTPNNCPRNVMGQPNRQLLLAVLADQNNLRHAITEQGASLESCQATLQ